MNKAGRVSLLVVAGIMVVQSVITLIAPADASANGRGFNVGYFFGQSAAGLDHYNVLENGLPRGSVGTDKQAFLEYIDGALKRSSAGGSCPGTGCDYVGAAYIIQTMRGGVGGWDFGYPDNADIADWVQKVRNPNIGLRWGNEGGAAGGITTARFRSGNRDVAQTSGTTGGQTLTFYNISTGKVYYMIRESCANPLGDLEGLPNATWDVSPGVSADRKTVRPGQTITWTHTVKNNGPATTQSIVNAKYQDRNGLGTGSGSNHPMASGTGAGGTLSFTSTYPVQPGDADKVLCRVTSASPRSSGDGSALTSGEACVTVVNEWTIGATAKVTAINATNNTVTKPRAKPNDLITWTHTVKNNGPDATRKVVTYRYENGTGLPAGSGATPWTLPMNSGTAVADARSQTSTYRIMQSNVGSDVCRKTNYTPQSWTNSNSNASPEACVVVPYDYTLTPTLMLDSTSDQGVVEAPTSVNVIPKVTNGGPTISRSTQWQLTRIDLKPADDIAKARKDAGGLSTSAPCAYLAPSLGSGSKCAPLVGGKSVGNSVFDVSGNVTVGDALSSIAQQINELPVGSKICFALSVYVASSNAPNNDKWAHSAAICLVVGKKPKVQVLGGDLVVGKGVASPGSKVVTSVSKPGKMFGSWSEYGIVASGSVTGMASASGYTGAVAVADLCNFRLLTLASQSTATKCDEGKIGGYKMTGLRQPQVASRFPITSSTVKKSGDLDVGKLATDNASQIYTDDGSASAKINVKSTKDIPYGKWIVIHAPKATVTISNNITYASSGTVSSIAAIPQVVIIAKNIIISEAVTQVDAWLVTTGTGAEGKLNTCGAGTGVGGVTITETSAVTSELCNKPLLVNGPVIVNHLSLRRTFGSGVTNDRDRGTPAEIFNLRPDAYLWATSYATGNGRVPTVSNKELPPRF